jgi:hypothetical protein
MRMLPILLLAGLALAKSVATAQETLNDLGGLQRRYTEGAVSHYVMTGDNDGREYTIRATDTVKRSSNGRFYEEIGWSDYTSDTPQTLTSASLALRQTVSLDDPVSYMKVPNLAGIQPVLIGPITDTLTFYSDLLLAIKSKLAHEGQKDYVSRSTPNSWADGQRILLGQDVVDFSLTVVTVNPTDHTETLLIQHLPPPILHIQQPVKWMENEHPTAPNNFVQVSKEQDGFVAETGRETFDVQLMIDSRDGRILSATMHNPVLLRTRTCTDRELTQCSSERPRTILRDITFRLVP